MIQYDFKVGDRIRYVRDQEPDAREFGEFRRTPDIAGLVGTYVGRDAITLDGVYSECAPDELLWQIVPRGSIRPEMLTVQQVFDIASYHMIEVLQGERAVHPEQGGCTYGAGADQACAVGALMPSNEVRLQADRTGTLASNAPEFKRNVFPKIGVPEEAVPVLVDIQSLHDLGALDGYPSSAYTYYNLTPGRRKYLWKRTLRRYAKRLGLVPRAWLGAESPKKVAA